MVEGYLFRLAQYYLQKTHKNLVVLSAVSKPKVGRVYSQLSKTKLSLELSILGKICVLHVVQYRRYYRCRR